MWNRSETTCPRTRLTRITVIDPCSSIYVIRWHLQFRLSEMGVDWYFAAPALRTVSRRFRPLYHLPMSDKQAIKSLRVMCSFGLLGLALIASSCGHTAASPPEVSINVVMKIIHDYGRGHDGLLSPASSAKSDENDNMYRAC